MIWLLVAAAVVKAAGDTAPVGATQTPSASLTPTAAATVINAVPLIKNQPAPFTGVLVQSDHMAYIVSIATDKQKTQPPRKWYYEVAGCLGQTIIGGFLLYKEVKH